VIACLVEENRVQKGQLKGRALRLSDDQRRRLAAKANVLGRKALERVATIVTPDTLMRWHHRLIALKWTYGAEKRVGRPGLMKAIKALIVRMAMENSTWGYCRIQGELKEVGHRVASTKVANVLKENGIRPAPDRPSSWRSFLQAHWGQVAGMDFRHSLLANASPLQLHPLAQRTALRQRSPHSGDAGRAGAAKATIP
jgi:transposase